MEILVHLVWYLCLLFFLPVYGSVYLLLLRPLTGGAWLDAVWPTLRALARGWWIAALLFALLVWLYPVFAFWPEPATEHLEELAHKRAPWFNWPAFLLRGVALFLVLGWTAETARRLPRPAMARAGLHLLALTLALFAFAVDWVMVVNGEWFSSAFPFTFILLGVSAAFGLALYRHVADVPPALRRQFSGLLSAAIALTTYVALMEFVIIWMGDIPAEAQYYVERTHTAMRWVPVYVVVVGFLFPFISLLPMKRRTAVGPFRVATAAALSGVALYLFWIINPLFP